MTDDDNRFLTFDLPNIVRGIRIAAKTDIFGAYSLMLKDLGISYRFRKALLNDSTAPKVIRILSSFDRFQSEEILRLIDCSELAERVDDLRKTRFKSRLR